MIRAISIHLRPSAPIFGLGAWMPTFPVVADLWRELVRGLFDPYRPELHYMRGPGPKWRAKHGLPETNWPGAVATAVARRVS